MIKAIVFDFDGMVFLTKELFSDRFSREYNVPLSEIIPFFKNEFTRCQEGKKDLKEELESYLPKWGWNRSTDDFLEYWFKDGELNQEIVKIINTLKQRGIICILCTNNEVYRIEYLDSKYSLRYLFDFVVASYEVGVRKPQRKIYDQIISITKLLHEEIVVFDDNEKHLAELKAQGFVPLQYQGLKKFREQMMRLGIVV